MHQFNSSDSQKLKDAVNLNDGRRKKRQSAGREQLCQTTYQYITPQAGLNSQGTNDFYLSKVNKSNQIFFFFLIELIKYVYRKLDVYYKSSRYDTSISENWNLRVGVFSLSSNPQFHPNSTN